MLQLSNIVRITYIADFKLQTFQNFCIGDNKIWQKKTFSKKVFEKTQLLDCFLIQK